MVATEANFLLASRTILAKRNSNERDFVTVFGASARVCALAWNMFLDGKKFRFKHLLWALMFVKIYATAAALAGLAGVCKETYMKWTWDVLILIGSSSNKVVSVRSFCSLLQ